MGIFVFWSILAIYGWFGTIVLKSVHVYIQPQSEENIVFKFEIYFQSFLDILYVKSFWWSPCSFNPL